MRRFTHFRESRCVKTDVTTHCEAGDLEYEFQGKEFWPGRAGRCEEPDDDDELVVSQFVAILVRGETVGFTTWDVAVLDVAAHEGRPIESVEICVSGTLLDLAAEQFYERVADGE